MYYLHNFLFIFSLRFGCRLTACLEIIIYFYGIYYMCGEYGFDELPQSMIIIVLVTSSILSVLMLLSTLHEHESSGIIFTYIMWGICTTIVLCAFYIFLYVEEKFDSWAVFLGVLVGTIVIKSYNMLVVISFLHMMVTSDSEDSF